MATRNFKNKFKYLSTLFETKEDFVQYLIDQNALNENFIKNVTETNSEQLSLKDFNYNNSYNYNVEYDRNKRKIRVNVAKNDIFSYYDTEDQLKERMCKYIDNEEYEKAHILKEYFNTIDLYFKK